MSRCECFFLGFEQGETTRFMKAVAVFVLFVGVVMVMQGYYNQTQQCPKQKTKVVMVPRSLYSEQLNPDRTVSQQFKSLFDDTLTWPATRG